MNTENKTELSVIIPSWNGKDLLNDCLESLIKNVNELSNEIIVVDNGSKDGTQELITGKYPSVKILSFEKNLGFTSAVNAGIKISSGRYILVLNNDVTVLNGAVKKLVEFMNKYKSVGIATSGLFYPDGTVQPVFYKFRTIPITLAETFFIDKLFPGTGLYKNSDFSFKENNGTPEDGWVMGAAMMIRKNVIDDTGGFDENSFTGDEDICFDAREKGWVMAVSEDAAMIHSHRQSSFSTARGLDSGWIGRMYFEFQRSACLSYIKRNPLWKGKLLFLIKKSASFMRFMLSSILYFLSVRNEETLKARIDGHFRFMCYPFEKMANHCDSSPSKKITIISPSPDVRGGVSQQVKCLFNSSIAGKFRLNHIHTHISGNRFKKSIAAFSGVWNFILEALFYPPHLAVIYMSGDASFLRKSIVMIIARMRKIKTIVYCHSYDFDHFYARSADIMKRYIRYILSGTDKIIVLSDYWKESLSYILGRKDIVIVPPFSQEIETFLSIPLDDKSSKPGNLLFMGAIEERKGIFVLLSAFSKVKDKLDNNCSLTIAGEGDIDAVQKYIEEENMSELVKIVGWADNDSKIKLFRETAIFVLPSFAEGFPLVLLEAMAGGIPVITGDIAGIRDLIKNGENGFLVEPGNTAELEEAIVNLLFDRQAREKIGKKARILIREKYMFEKNIKILEEEFEKILSKS